MIVAWIVGFVLSLLAIWLLKGSRLPKKTGWCDEVIKPERPVLKVWSLVLFILGSLVPIGNILMGLVTFIWWAIAVFGDECWNYTRSTKFLTFLNKSIG